MTGPEASRRAATATQPSVDELRAEAMEWGSRARGLGTWYVMEHMVRAMRAYGWTIVVARSRSRSSICWGWRSVLRSSSTHR